MKKFCTVLAFLFVGSLGLRAQAKFDTVSVNFVAPGVKYIKVEVPSKPLKMNVLEVDLKNKYCKIQTATSGNKVPNMTRETVSAFSKRFTDSTQTVVGAVNADFFSFDIGLPLGKQIIGGEIVKSCGTPTVIGFDRNNKPFLNLLEVSSTLTAKGKTAAIDGYNVQNAEYYGWYNLRSANRIVLYNSYFDYSARNETPDVELIARPIDQWKVNGVPTRLIIAEKGKDISSKAQKTDVVLGGFGTGADFLNQNISAGDTVSVDQSVAGAIPDVRYMAGMYPRTVVNGKNYAQQGYEEMGKDDAINPTHVNPLTVAGFNRDSTKLFIVVCDGWWDNYSIGLTSVEMADYLISLGVYNGGNFDGGGSSEMVVRGEVMNRPTDGSERMVMNAAMVVSTAPKNGNLSGIDCTPNRPGLFLGQSSQIRVKGIDAYYNPITIDTTKAQFSLTNPKLGSVSSTGFFTAGNTPGQGIMVVTYNGVKDSVLLRIKGIKKMVLAQKEVTTNATRGFGFAVQGYDEDNVYRAIKNNQILWNITDPAIGRIDSNGVFSGLKEGNTRVIAEFKTDYCDIKDTASISVIIGTGKVVVDSCTGTCNWSISGDNLDSTYSSITSNHQRCKVNYGFVYDPAKIPMIRLSTFQAIKGLPDSIFVNIKTNGLNNRLWFMFSDKSGNMFKVSGKAYASSKDGYISIPGLLSAAVNQTNQASIDYPLYLRQLIIQPACLKQTGVKYQDSLFISGISVSYPKPLDVKDAKNPGLDRPEEFSLCQNYPNPFNPSTTISFNLDKDGFASLEVYNILGQRIAVLASEFMHSGFHNFNWNAAKSPSGIYIYRLTQGNKAISKKMLLIK